MRAKYYTGEGKRSGPEEIDELLGSIVARAGASGDFGVARLVAAWDEVVPERWKGRSRPIGIREQTLLVEVTTGADASLLRYDAPTLVGRIAERFGPELVKEVRFRVAGDVRGGKP